MKNLLLLGLLVFFGTQLLAQNPDILGTWYVYKYSTAFSGEKPLPQTTPQISPFITFIDSPNPDNMLGDTGCNTFTASISYNQNESYTIDALSITQETCNDPVAEDFTDVFHEFIGEGNEATYLFFTENGEQKLLLNGMLESELYLQREPLSVSEFSANTFKVYPNPASEKLFVTSENISIDKIAVFSITGKKVLDIKSVNDFIDVSKLSKGMYFLEISSGDEKSVQKFIKN
jgi:hypothetical protein